MKTTLLYLFLLAIYPGKRQVLIFYNANGTALKDKQLAELKKNATGVEDRDMIVYTYSTTAKEEVKKWKIDAAKPFTVLLIGKDDGEKMRSDSVVNAATFFNTIDAMPMRKSEIKENR